MEVAIKGSEGVGNALTIMRAKIVSYKIYRELKFKNRIDKPHKERSAKSAQAIWKSRLRLKSRLVNDALLLHSLGL